MDWEEMMKTVELAAPYVMKLLGALVALFCGWVVAGWLGRTIRRHLERRSFDTTLTRFFARMARYAVLTFVVLGCLGLFGIETASFAAVLAAGGLAIGLAFQGTLSNFAAGVMLLVFRPFKVGDLVRIDGELGEVEEIDLFTTDLKTLDARRIILPNSAIFGAKIENLTHYPLRRVDIDVGTSYSADLDQTRAVLEAAAERVANGVHEPKPQIFLAGFGDSAINWQVRVWCRPTDYWTVWEQSVSATKEALDRAGISIPFPQMNLHLERVDGSGLIARAANDLGK